MSEAAEPADTDTGTDRARLRPREWLVDYAFRTGWTISRHAPEPVAGRVLEGVADRVWSRRGDGVRQLELNLARAAPDADAAEVRALSQQAMRSYFRYWHEVFQLPAWSHRQIVDRVVTVNEEPLRAAFAAGTGAVVALPHMANWDLAGAWACLTGMPVSTVAERLKPESVFDRFVGYRTALGMEVTPLTGSVNPLATLTSALERGRVVCLVADRDLSRSGLSVTLLGEQATLPGGPALLARRTGAPLIALSLSYVGPLLRLDLSDPVPVQPGRDGLIAMTQELADHFSAGIRRSPYDWHMLQQVFTADADRSR